MRINFQKHLALAVIFGLLLSPHKAIANDIGKQLFGILGNAVKQGIDRDLQQKREKRKRTRTIHWADIQRELNALGFNAGPVDNSPGQQTYAAIRAFQNSIGQRSDGQLTKRQLNILFNKGTALANQSVQSRTNGAAENNRRKVASALLQQGNRNKPAYFRLKVPRHYQGDAIRYVQQIGGTVIESGDAYYTLIVDEKYYRDTQNLVVEAKILDYDYNTRIKSLKFFSQLQGRCSQRTKVRIDQCTRLAGQFRKRIFYEFN